MGTQTPKAFNNETAELDTSIVNNLVEALAKTYCAGGSCATRRYPTWLHRVLCIKSFSQYSLEIYPCDHVLLTRIPLAKGMVL